MKLIHCRIENFGKLHNLDLDFQDGLNYFCQNNGWGKSTFAVFLQAMFYGLSGERKKAMRDNDRKRFRPWQGGIFGGSLTFETGGKTYLVTRVFHEKESLDEFELRDAVTNRISYDYSSRLGEELFSMSRESFLRTTYIGQNDCRTRLTDDVQAKIGASSEADQDLAQYENAQKQLGTRIAQLKSGRQGASIPARRKDISELTLKINQGEKLPEKIAEYEERVQKEEEKNQKLEEQFSRTKKKMERAGKLKDKVLSKDRKQQLMETVRQKKLEVEKMRDRFPGEIPDLEEIDRLIPICVSQDMAEQEVFHYQLSPEEKQKYDAKGGRKNAEKKRKRTKYQMVYGCLVSMILILFGIYLAVMNIFLWPMVLPLGLGGLAISVILYLQEQMAENEDSKHMQEDNEDQVIGYDVVHSSLKFRMDHFQKALAKYQECNQVLVGFLEEHGYVPSREMSLQFQEIRNQVKSYQEAWKDLEDASEELRRIREEYGEEEEENLLPSKEEELSNLSDLTARMNQLSDELRRNADQLYRDRNHLAKLRSRLDELEERKKELEELLRLQAEDEKTYRYLKLAQEGLIKAREARSQKYAASIQMAFAGYVELVTGRPADQFYMDSNSKVTIMEQGKQRAVELFSEGYQDLIGFCMRLALCDAMYQSGNDCPVLILDDPFVNLDDEKKEAGLRLLDEVSKAYQIIYFTCSHSRQG